MKTIVVFAVLLLTASCTPESTTGRTSSVEMDAQDRAYVVGLVDMSNFTSAGQEEMHLIRFKRLVESGDDATPDQWASQIQEVKSKLETRHSSAIALVPDSPVREAIINWHSAELEFYDALLCDGSPSRSCEAKVAEASKTLDSRRSIAVSLASILQ